MAAAEACGAAAACDATDARAPLASRLRSGRFSVVQSAVHLKEKARYAVKVVENKSLGDEENLEALETEIDILRKLEHPHIVSLKEVVVSTQDTYIVMELLSGVSATPLPPLSHVHARDGTSSSPAGPGSLVLTGSRATLLVCVCVHRESSSIVSSIRGHSQRRTPRASLRRCCCRWTTCTRSTSCIAT